MAMYCKSCENVECRCESCAMLVEVADRWFCDHYEVFCDEVKKCALYEDATGCSKDEVLPKERFEDFVRCQLREVEEADLEEADLEEIWVDGYTEALSWVLTLIECESEVRYV